MRRRGQAAFEFLATYGWAFLVIFIMMGALSYFGIMNPSKFLPERCNFQSEIICGDYQLDGGAKTANLRLRHNIGETVLLENVTCTFDNGGIATDTPNASESEWSPTETVEVTCSPGATSDILISGQKEKVNIEVNYKFSSSGYPHTAEGEVYANVQ